MSCTRMAISRPEAPWKGIGRTMTSSAMAAMMQIIQGLNSYNASVRAIRIAVAYGGSGVSAESPYQRSAVTFREESADSVGI